LAIQFVLLVNDRYEYALEEAVWLIY